VHADTRVVLALALAAVPACDREDEDEDEGISVEIRDAHASWNAANHSLASAYDRFVTHVQLEQFGEIDRECADGGVVHLVGRMSEHRDFQLDAMFDDCTEEGVVLDGHLTLTASLELFYDEGTGAAFDHDDIRALVIVDYHGMLQLDGDAAGSCFIAAQVHASALIFAGFASDAVVVDGEVCGFDANAVVLGAATP
jgi:hypothetical protein